VCCSTNIQCRQTNDLFKKVDIYREASSFSENLLQSMKPGIQSSVCAIPNAVNNVFLTGGSGYLGSAIIRELLQTEIVCIFALVRCRSESEGLERLRGVAMTHGWGQEMCSSRVRVLPGDLTKPNFGLQDSDIELLRGTSDTGSQVNTIIHCGAKVHYSSSYEMLKTTNILPTLDLLKMCIESPNLSRLLFVSGGTKPNASDDDGDRNDTYSDNFSNAGGYAQTKAVSEQIVRRCAKHKMFQSKMLSVVKPGYIVGSDRTGVANTNDFIWRLIVGCIEVGGYNVEEAEHWLFIADADTVARSVVTMALEDRSSSGHVSEVRDGLHFSELWALLSQDFGYKLHPLGLEEWMVRLKEAVETKGESHVLFPLLHVLERDGGMMGSHSIPSGQYPKVKEVVRRNVQHLIDVGFFPTPIS
jgi:thioester reductase-like protein